MISDEHLAELYELGFDKSLREDNTVYVRCSQCEALVLNGVACHELGCINHRNERLYR